MKHLPCSTPRLATADWKRPALHCKGCLPAGPAPLAACVLQFLLRCTVALPHAHSPLPGCSAVVGELDDDLDANVDYDSLRAAPLKPVAH